VLEVGSGLGALTYLMIDRYKVYSLEIDKGIFELLNSLLKKPNLILFNEDFLKFDLSKLNEKILFFISNVPYSITGEVLKKFIDCPEFNAGIMMLQEELLERMLAPVSDSQFGPFSILCRYYLDVKKLFPVNRNSFFPAPTVDSAAIQMNKKKTSIPQNAFNTFLRKAFLAKRKTIYNNLKDSGFSKEALIKTGVDPAVRPQDITIELWEKLYLEFEKLKKDRQ
jgi:16S rRNA (adenine1518-N6/adenine1519-N6)-dimethyltransferase